MAFSRWRASRLKMFGLHVDFCDLSPRLNMHVAHEVPAYRWNSIESDIVHALLTPQISMSSLGSKG